MKHMLYWICFALSLVGLAGCWGSDGKPGTMALTTALDDTGQPVESATRFAPGETIYLALELVEAYDGLEVQVSWVRNSAGGEHEVLKEETLHATRAVDALDPLWLSARLETDAGWPAGVYACQVFIPDQGTTDLPFTLE